MPLDFSKLDNVKRLAGGGVQARCPACSENGGDKKGNHLRIMPNGAYGCAIHKGDKVHNQLIWRLVGQKEGAEVSEGFDFAKVEMVPKIEIEEIYPDSILENLIRNDDYWIKRGIPSSVLMDFECGLASRGKMNKRYCFAIRDFRGKIHGFTGRIVDNSSEIKWKHLGKTGNWVFPYPYNREEIKKAGFIILVESIGDLLALWKLGIKNVLVLFGVNISQILLSTLVGINPKKIVIATNNDTKHEVGQTAANKIKERLSLFFNDDRVVIGLPDSKDFGIMADQDILNWYNKHAN